MTPFTDDDLKRLIEIKNKGISMSDEEAIEFNRLWLKNPPALLSRLEAAEIVAQKCYLACMYTKETDKWRKAAGK